MDKKDDQNSCQKYRSPSLTRYVSFCYISTMPVHHHLPKEGIIYQREQYAKGGAGRWYWDYKDSTAFSYILPEHKNIIDLGCGEGLALEKLMKGFPGRNVMGVDLELENIEICRRHALNAVYSNLYDLALPDAHFDVCVCIDVLEHLEDPVRAVREMNRILRRNGRLIMLVPHDRNFFLARLAFFMFKEAFYETGHQRRWNPKQVERLVSSEGLSIIAQKNLPFLLWQTSFHHLLVAEKT